MKNLFLIFFIFISQFLFAQNFTISGYVTDVNTGEKLIGATVYESNYRAGTVTNEYGFYSITLVAGNINLVYSFVGYSSNKINFILHGDTIINPNLTSNITLKEVTVTSDKETESIQERSEMSTIEIPIEQIKSLPAFLGEVDVLKSLQLLPGVQSGTEGTSGLFVRGGSPDQNLILLDGVPVYNATHLFGFFSVFNADALNKVTLIKGGFPARYGGRLSSVIDIRMKEGNLNTYHGEGSIGIVASKFTFEGPIKKGKSSFIISARRTYIDILAQPFILARSNGQSTGGYFFYDLNAKLNYKFSDKDRLYLSGYFGRDKFYFKDKTEFTSSGVMNSQTFKGDLGWGNATAVLRWNHIITKKLFSNVTATYSSYQFDISSVFEDVNNSITTTNGLYYLSGIDDWALKSDFDFIPSPSHYIKFGVGAIMHTFKPGASEYTSTSPDFNPVNVSINSAHINAVEPDIYIEDDWEITTLLKANIGVHTSGFFVDSIFYNSVQPRISARYLINKSLSIKASFSTMTQYIHLLSNVGVGLPTDLWVPSTALIKPEKAWQQALGFAYNLYNKYEFSIEGYYKKMNDIIEYKDGASYLNDGSTEWENKVEAGEGWAYGAEFFIQKKEGKTTGWIGYTLAWSNRQFPTINLGEKYSYKYDRRHDVSVAVIHKFNNKIEASLVWVYGTGQALSLPVAQYEGLYGQTLLYYEGRNAYRMPDYNRLDLNVSFKKQKKRWERTWNIGIYNAYNRKNPFFIYLGEDDSGNATYKQVSLFPIIPSVSYDFKF